MKTIHSKTGVRKLYKEFAESRTRNIQVAFLLQDWEDPYNVGGMFRVADACGAHEMVFSGRTPVPPDPQIGVTSLGHHRRVSWRELGRNEEAAIKLKEEGYTLVAVEIADGAVHYMEYTYPEKVCLVLGNEVKGVYGSVMKHCEAAVFIPMSGKGRSLNVHVAGAVVAFQAMLGSE
jgi:tRNA (guanosine-2'-O-)-methyltransferase